MVEDFLFQSTLLKLCVKALFTSGCRRQNFRPCLLRLVNNCVESIYKTKKTRTKNLPFATAGEQCFRTHNEAFYSCCRCIKIQLPPKNPCFNRICVNKKTSLFSNFLLILKRLKHLLSTSNFTSTLINHFVLEHSDFKTKQLRSVLVKLLVLNQCLNGLG